MPLVWMLMPKGVFFLWTLAIKDIAVIGKNSQALDGVWCVSRIWFRIETDIGNLYVLTWHGSDCIGWRM